MSPERWKKIGELCDYALGYAEGEREERLKSACGDDKNLYDEVKSLLIRMNDEESFLSNPLNSVTELLAKLNQSENSLKGKLVGEFEIIEEIGVGEGGSGRIYLAQDTSLNRKVVLKSLSLEHIANEDLFRRFKKEAEIVAPLNHHNIVAIYKTHQENNTFYIVMEHIEGESLRQYLSKQIKPLELQEALNIAIQIAEALAFAHEKGVIHRDIKPENIIIPFENRPIKVLDFGIAKVNSEIVQKKLEQGGKSQKESIKTPAGVPIGTVNYMSPEQARGLPIDEKTDIWSLGVLLYEMITGHRPFEGISQFDVVGAIHSNQPLSLSHYVGDLPPKLQRIIDKVLSKDKDKRYSTIREFQNDLKSLKNRKSTKKERFTISSSINNFESQNRSNDNHVCPYQGLFPFTKENAKYFKGRDAATTELCEALAKRSFVAYTSASGFGKTSVIRAGVIPQLEVKENYLIISLRPQSNPFQSLAVALIPFLFPDLPQNNLDRKVNELIKNLRKSSSALWEKINQIKRKFSEQKSVLLIIDQFEDIYASCKENSVRRDFLNSLFNFITNARKSGNTVKFLVAMRVDVLERLPKDHGFTGLVFQEDIRLKPMTEKELYEAIIMPLREVGMEIETGLPERIVEHLDITNNVGGLPLLAFTLQQLWTKRQKAKITHASYEEIGNVRKALANYAEKVYSELDNEQKLLFRKIMLNLIEVNDSVLAPSRRVLEHGELTELEWELVLDLAEDRLLTINFDPITHQETVELVHESLTRAWERYQNWIEENREFLIWRSDFNKLFKKIKKKSTSKEDPKMSSEYRFLEGEDLEDAIYWLGKIKEFPSLYSVTEKEETFILDSQRIKRELKYKKYFWLTVIPVLLIAGMWIYFSSRADNSLAQNLLISANKIKQDNSERVGTDLLLAVESYKRSPSIDAYHFIHENLPLFPKLRLSVQHRDAVFTPDRQHIISVGNDHEVFYWDLRTGQVTKKFNQRIFINKVANTKNGKYLALGGKTTNAWKNVELPVDISPEFDNNVVVIVDTETNKTIHTLKQPDQINNLDFSPDGKYLATNCIGEDIHTVHLWDVNTGELKTDFRSNKNGYIRDFTFSPEGKYIAAVFNGLSAQNSGIYVWDLTTEIEKFLPNDQMIMEANFSPDGRFLAFGGKDRSVHLVETNSWQERNSLKLNEPINTIEFSPDGKLLAAGTELYLVGKGNDHFTTRVFDLANGQEISRFNQESDVHSLAFSPNGQYIISSSYNHNANDNESESARIWEVRTGQEISKTHLGDSAIVSFTPDGKNVLAKINTEYVQAIFEQDDKSFTVERRNPANLDDTIFVDIGVLIQAPHIPDLNSIIKLWDPFSKPLEVNGLSNIISGENPTSNKWYGYIIPSNYSITKNGLFLVDAQNDLIKIWNLAEGKEIASFPNDGKTYEIRISEDGKYVVANNGKSAFESKNVKTIVWDVQSKKNIYLIERENFSHSLDISPDNQYFAEINQGIVHVHELKSGKSLLSVSRSNIAPMSVSFSPADQQIAIGSLTDVQIWDLSTNQGVFNFEVTNGVPKLKYSKDGRFLALINRDSSSVLIYETKQFQKIVELKHESKIVSDFDFNTDSKYIVTSDESGFFYIWNIDKGQKIAKIKNKNGVASFSKDNSLILTQGKNVSIQKWLPEDIIKEACSRLSYNLSKTEWEKYLPGEEYQETCKNHGTIAID